MTGDVGKRVRVVRDGPRPPLPGYRGKQGVVVAIQHGAGEYTHLVCFDDGEEAFFAPHELELLDEPA